MFQRHDGNVCFTRTRRQIDDCIFFNTWFQNFILIVTTFEVLLWLIARTILLFKCAHYNIKNYFDVHRIFLALFMKPLKYVSKNSNFSRHFSIIFYFKNWINLVIFLILPWNLFRFFASNCIIHRNFLIKISTSQKKS